MTDYIHSFLIDPVLRRARCPSAARANSDPNSTSSAAGEPASHAKAPSTEEVTNIATIEDGNTTVVEDVALMIEDGVPEPGQPFGDAAVPLPAQGEQGSQAGETTSSNAGFATPVAPGTPTSLRESNAPGYMSSNPSYGAHRAMSGDSLVHPQSHRSSASTNSGNRSRGSTGREAPAAIIEEMHNIVLSESLPEDDGMKLLRQRIHEIREQDVSNEEKARRMHVLMTEKYIQSQSHLVRSNSPASFLSQDQPPTPASALFGGDGSAPPHSPLLPSAPDPENPFNIDTEALKPTYRPRLPRALTEGDPSSEPIDEDGPEEEPQLGCIHYLRNVKVQCFECRRWYSCRHCHDEDPLATHKLDRKKTQNMLCMLCGTPQAAAEYCCKCGEMAARYYCDICKLWDNDSTKSIYHCKDCGICRKGEGLGKDYVHCKKCNVCISISHFPSHRCLERATDCDCPICGSYLFTSPSPVISLRCGHYMHAACRLSYLQTAYKCPICARSSVNMELQWRKLDEEIRRQPMPDGEGGRVEVRCNDCGQRGVAEFHWLGNRCGGCEGYNTNVLRVVEGRGGGADGGAAAAAGEAEAVEAQLDGGVRERVGEAALVGVSPPRLMSLRGREIRGSYFRPEASEAHTHARPSSAASAADGVGVVFALSPFQMAQRFARSLSPMRDLVLGGGMEEEGRDGAGAAGRRGFARRSESFRFWGLEGGFLRRGMGVNGRGEGGSEGSEGSEEDGGDEEAEDVEEAGTEELDGMEIFGHR